MPVSEKIEKLRFKDLFSDLELARECENNCASKLLECIEECGTLTECIGSCNRNHIICVDSCPCNLGNDYKFCLLGSHFLYCVRTDTGDQ